MFMSALSDSSVKVCLHHHAQRLRILFTPLKEPLVPLRRYSGLPPSYDASTAEPHGTNPAYVA